MEFRYLLKIRAFFPGGSMLVWLGCISIFFACSNATDTEREPGEPNALENETSPYLLKHVDNPVNWYPWNENTLAKARRENKLLLISIGYASCHWCHVMERESFMNEEIASIMNENFINIKVDREERPDVDQVYMNALQLVTGGGGWPLNAFATPDGRPFFAATYLEPGKWSDLLEKIISMRENDPDALNHIADQITEGIAGTESLKPLNIPGEYPESLLYKSINRLYSGLDIKSGGFAYDPKFFYAPALIYLLEQSLALENVTVNQDLHHTLLHIWKGGIFDHVGGGFSRYAVDAEWNIPHFEKMLYDNAQLISLYAKAYKDKPDPVYEIIVKSTINFVISELKAPAGGYYSSLDAESEGKEGAFYTWEYDQLEEIAGEAGFAELKKVFDISLQGNWEKGENILFLKKEPGEENLKSGYMALLPVLKKLQHQREKRIKPAVDDKIITSWNALLLSGLTAAYRSFGDDMFLDSALELGRFLEGKRMDGARLYRISTGDKFKIEAFLDDYSYLIRAYIDLYQVTFDERWLSVAVSLQQQCNQNFYDKESGIFYYSDNSRHSLVVRRFEIPDNVMPSPNAVCAQNLLILGDLFENENWMNMARQMVAGISGIMETDGPFMTSWYQVYAYLSLGIREVIIIGPEAEAFRRTMQKIPTPNTIFIGGEGEGNIPLADSKLIEGKTMIYVCENRVCKMPVSSAEEAVSQLRPD